MNNTKWLRRALLGGAALSVMATGAQADELAALKAQLETLQSRVSQLESQPAATPVLPAGTKLLTLRKGQGTYSNLAALPARDRLQDHQGYTIAITPTADMPAPVSEVTVSGEIRLRALFSDVDVDGSIDLNANDTTSAGEEDWEGDDFDLTTRARLRVDGKTETSIGEVGGSIRLQGTRGGYDSGAAKCCDESVDFAVSIAWGYWQMTPSLQFGGGYWDSLAAIQAGWDWNGEPSLVGLDAGPTNASVSQVRLTYSQGGLTAAISLEDNNERTTNEDGNSRLAFGDAVMPAVAGYIAFDAGSFLVTASGIWEADDTETTANGYEFNDTDDNWMVGVGAIVKLSDIFRLEGAANIGEGYRPGTYVASVNGSGVATVCTPTNECFTRTRDIENDMEYWGANVMAVIAFSEGFRVELGAAYSNVDHEEDELGGDVDDTVEKAWTVAGSLFWDPVDQLTLGAGVGFTHKDSDDEDGEYDSINAGFGAWFRF
jgi:hypothetical protein